MGNLKELLKDKKKMLLLVIIFIIGILLIVVFFVKGDKISPTGDSSDNNQAFLEPVSKDEVPPTNKIEAYKKLQEEEARRKREQEEPVKGSDFYFGLQEGESYNKRLKERIGRMQHDPYSEVMNEYKDENGAFSNRMRQQLSDIEDQETFDQIVKAATKEERIRKGLEENAQFRERMKQKMLEQQEAKESKQANILPKVEDDDLEFSDSILKPRFIVENGKRRRRSQYTPPQKVNLIKAAVYGDQIIVSGSAVRMRLLEPVWTGGIEIPANTIFYGNAIVGANRLKVTVENLRYGKFISPVAFIIYDSDAIEGLNLPNNMKAEAARKMEAGLLNGVQLPISSIGTVTSEVTSAITATTQVAKQILNQSLSQVKVHLKANYNLFIKEETQEDRKKREAENTEMERLYKQMQLQQNEPTKKNPLASLIETL